MARNGRWPTARLPTHPNPAIVALALTAPGRARLRRPTRAHDFPVYASVSPSPAVSWVRSLDSSDEVSGLGCDSRPKNFARACLYLGTCAHVITNPRHLLPKLPGCVGRSGRFSLSLLIPLPLRFKTATCWVNESECTPQNLYWVAHYFEKVVDFVCWGRQVVNGAYTELSLHLAPLCLNWVQRGVYALKGRICTTTTTTTCSLPTLVDAVVCALLAVRTHAISRAPLVAERMPLPLTIALSVINATTAQTVRRGAIWEVTTNGSH